MKWYAFVITILGILSSGMIDALTIQNGTDKKLEIKSIEDGAGRELRTFTDVPKTIPPNGSITISNKSQSEYYALSDLRPYTKFNRLTIWVEYEGESYKFDTDWQNGDTANKLKNNKLDITFKMPTTKSKQTDYYFDTKSDLSQLNARFAPPRKLRQ